MLFNYIYISHDMEKMQKYMDFIFFEVWCKAKKNKPYKFYLFNRHKELKNIIVKLYHSDSQGSDLFMRCLEDIYCVFQKFADGEKAKLKKWYQKTTDIKKLCNNERGYVPINYKKLSNFHSKLSDKLKTLYDLLYGSNPINELKEFKSYTTTIGEHYKEFMKINNKGICPFCGLLDMLGTYDEKKEDYDHFLPKDKYPFNSINFKNLAPMCHECNSSYKLENNPIFDKDGNRRKAFYPYSLKETNIDVKVNINSVNDIKPENITLSITAPEQGKVDTWIKLFGIEERYKAILSSESDGKYWLVQLKDEVIIYNNKLKEHFKKYPYSERNFLKVAFFEAL